MSLREHRQPWAGRASFAIAACGFVTFASMTSARAQPSLLRTGETMDGYNAAQEQQLESRLQAEASQRYVQESQGGFQDMSAQAREGMRQSDLMTHFFERYAPVPTRYTSASNVYGGRYATPVGSYSADHL